MAKANGNTGTKGAATTPAKPAAKNTVQNASATKAASAPRPAPNLGIKVLPWPTNVVQPRANTKRAAWVAAILGAKTVAQALAAPLPAGVPPLGMGQVNWCVRNKLVATMPGPAPKA